MSDPASNPESPESSRQDSSRRRFLKGGAALGAALVAGAGLPRAGRAQPAPDDPSKVLGAPVRPYGERSRFEQAVREKFPLSKTDEVGEHRHAFGRNVRDHHAVSAALSRSTAAAFRTSTPRSTVS